MARAPGKCSSMFLASSAAKPASESPAASSTACANVPADSSTSLAGSAAKPATDQQQALSMASESTTLTLADVFSKLEGNASNADAQQLLQDIPVLQEWKTATHPSNKVRDAMMKLASHWNVTQKAKGKKRTPCEVAKDMEDSMLKRA